MDFLQEYHKPLQSHLYEMIHIIADMENTEPRQDFATMTDKTARKLLQRRLELSTTPQRKDSPSRFKESEEYIDCYIIPSRGRQLREKWIKNISRQKEMEKTEKAVMSVTTKDILLKRVDLKEWNIPDSVKLPPRWCPVYVVCERWRKDQHLDKKFPELIMKGGSDAPDKNDAIMKFDRVERRVVSHGRNKKQPPPVPPKPNNLILGGGIFPAIMKRVGNDERNSSEPQQHKQPLEHCHLETTVMSEKNSVIKLFQEKPSEKPLSLKLIAEPVSSTCEVAEQQTDSVTSRVESMTIQVGKSFPENQAEKDEEVMKQEEDGCVLDCSISKCRVVDLECVSKKLINERHVEDENNTDEPTNTPQNKNTPTYSMVDLKKKHSRLIETGAGKEQIRMKFQAFDVENQVNEKEESVIISEKSPIEVDSEGMSTVAVEGGGSEEMRVLGENPGLKVPSSEADPPLPKQLSTQTFQSDEDSSSNSYYEDIEILHCTSLTLDGNQSIEANYLDPKFKERACGLHSWKNDYKFNDLNAPAQKLLPKGSLLMTEISEVCQLPQTVSAQLNEPNITSTKSSADSSMFNVLSNISDKQLPDIQVEGSMKCGVMSSHSSTKAVQPRETIHKSSKFKAFSADLSDSMQYFQGSRLAFDRDGHALFIPSQLLRKYGEPVDEPWFYPLPLTSHQASLFLIAERLEGCFVVYRSSPVSTNGAIYNLSVYLENGDVVHYHLVQNIYGDVMVEGHDHAFMTVADLVDYFSRNKSSLATRLRRPLKRSRLPITPGYDYDISYELERKELMLTGGILGQGYFGVVCAGVYHDEPVAIKVLQQMTEGMLTEEDDFVEEAKSLMLLKHEHIIRLVGVSCTARPFFIVTEFASGGSLKECLQSRRLPANDINALLRICIQMTSSLSYMENMCFMLHRDLASRNFLMSGDFNVKLADFGRARLVSDDSYHAPKKERICIKWASPEVLTDSLYSTKSDVWALGVVFWEVFSWGKRPYGILSGEQTAVYVVEGGQLEKPPECPAEFYQLMRTCWREDPLERPSFCHLLEQLRNNSSLYCLHSVESPDWKRSTLDGSQLVSPVSSKPTTPSSVKSLLLSMSGKKLEVPFEDLHNEAQQRGHFYYKRHWTSSSETSIASANGILDTEKDDELKRSDRIRKSLRNLMKIKEKVIKSPIVNRKDVMMM